MLIEDLSLRLMTTRRDVQLFKDRINPAVVAFAAVACALVACSRKNEPPRPTSSAPDASIPRSCVGHLERVADRRSVPELFELPEISPRTQLHHAFRDPRFLAVNGVEEGVEQFGDYRVTWSVDSDRGRPGPAQVTISLPGLCDGGEINQSFTGTSGLPATLRRDVTSGTDVLLLWAWPDAVAIAFRLVPERTTRTPPP